MLVIHISSMHLVESYGNRVGDATQSEYKAILPSEGQAVTRTMLPVLKHLAVPWLQAKMELRMAVLKGFETCFESVCLLKTSPWEPNLFPKAAITNLAVKRLNNIPQLLGLNKPNTLNTKTTQLPPQKRRFIRYDNQTQFHNKRRQFPTPIQSFQDRKNGGRRRDNKNKINQQPPRKPANNKSNNQNNKSRPNKPNISTKGPKNQSQK